MQVTVLMVTYNHEKYIEDAIKAIFNQSFKYNFNFIISDDCSKDNTPLIIESMLKYAPPHISVQFFQHKENMGGIANFNFCLSKISEGFVVVADGDDISKQDRIEILYNLHIKLDKDLYISNAEEIDETGNSVGTYKYISSFDCSKLSYSDVYTSKTPVFGASYAFDSRIIKVFGIVDPILVTKNNIDQIFFWRAILGNGCYYVDESLIFYRIHNTNASISKQKEVANEQGKNVEAKFLTVFMNLNRIGNIIYILQEAYADKKLIPLFQKFHKEFDLLQYNIENLKKISCIRGSNETRFLNYLLKLILDEKYTNDTKSKRNSEILDILSNNLLEKQLSDSNKNIFLDMDNIICLIDKFNKDYKTEIMGISQDESLKTKNVLTICECQEDLPKFSSFQSIKFRGREYDLNVKSLKSLEISAYIDTMHMIFTGKLGSEVEKKVLIKLFKTKKFTKLEFALVMMKKFGIFPMPFTNKFYMFGIYLFKWFKIKNLSNKLV